MTRSRRALCALAVGALLVGSGLAFSTPALAAADAAGTVAPAGAALPEQQCALVDVRLRGEPVVGSTLIATVAGGPFDGAAVTFDWLVGPAPVVPPTPEPSPPSRPTPVPTATPAPEPSPTPSPTAEPTPEPTPVPTPEPTRGEYIVRGADLGQVVTVRAIANAADDGSAQLSCLSAPSAVVRAGDAPGGGTAIPPLPQPVQPEPGSELALDAALDPILDATPGEWAAEWDEEWAEEPEAVDEVAPEPPAAASGPIVNINLSDDVLLIGGLGALAVMAGLLVFGRNGD